MPSSVLNGHSTTLPPSDSLSEGRDGLVAAATQEIQDGGDHAQPADLKSVADLPSSSPVEADASPPRPPALEATPPQPTPRVSSTPALLSPFLSPHGPLSGFSALSQECVSVVVRLKGPTAVGGARLASPASSPRAAALLDYTISDGPLRTPRTARRLPSRGSNTGTPHPPSELCSPSSADPPTYTRTASPLQQEPADGGTPRLPVAAPRAITQGGPAASSHSAAVAASAAPTVLQPTSDALPGIQATAATPATASTTSVSRPAGSSACAAPGSASSAASGGFIGSRGKVLSLFAPNSDECRQYEFGDVIEPDVSNAAMCERLLPAVMEQLQAGYNVCVLCYGQTGSGKTYTVNALTPAIASDLFGSLDTLNEVVEMSYIQIYNNKAYNLLDNARGSRLGAELSKPPQAALAESSGAHSSSSSGGGGGAGGVVSGLVGSAWEPKALVRSAAEVVAKVRTASRLRVTHAHALNPRSSRSFTLLTLHLTRFLDGAPLTTTRVTLADLAGTERLKKSGATGEGQSQAIFINKSLLALRELVESGGADGEVLHYRDALLTTYLAPRMRSWHLFLLVTASLEPANYEETKSSLDFATNARRRRIKKVRSRVADRLSGAASRLHASLGQGGGGGAAGGVGGLRSDVDVAEMQSVVEALHFRIRTLEETLRLEQQQRGALERFCSPLVSPRLGEVPFSPSAVSPVKHTGDDDDAEGRDGRLRRSDAQIRQLRSDCHHYRQLLREREEDLRRVQALLSPGGGAAAALVPPPAALMDLNGSLLLSSGTPPLDSISVTGDGSGGGAVGVEEPPSPTSSLSASLTSADPPSDASPADETEDAHAQLAHSLRQLRRALGTEGSTAAAVERMRNDVLRAKEAYDEVRERLLVVTSSLGGLRAQHHLLREEALRAGQEAVAQRERRKLQADAALAERARAAMAEAAAEELRMHLFRAYAEQPIGEELTRLYVDEQPAVRVVDSLTGTQLAEHHEELAKFEARQRTLQDKITELVNTVEQLTRANTQKDVSLTALESIITPAQRALFHTMSTNGPDGNDAAGAAVAEEEAGVGGGAADFLSLLQSRLSELQALLVRERQQHQLTRCEVVEAREDARRSRQEQRQAVFQQHEEERRVAQLSEENFELRQQCERHQLYLDQIHVRFQEQLLELRRFHEREMAELRRTQAAGKEEGEGGGDEVPRRPSVQLSTVQQPGWESNTSSGEGSGRRDEDEAEPLVGSGALQQASTRRATSSGAPPTTHDRAASEVVREGSGPAGQSASFAPAAGGGGTASRLSLQLRATTAAPSAPAPRPASSSKAKEGRRTLKPAAKKSKTKARRSAGGGSGGDGAQSGRQGTSQGPAGSHRTSELNATQPPMPSLPPTTTKRFDSDGTRQSAVLVGKQR